VHSFSVGFFFFLAFVYTSVLTERCGVISEPVELARENFIFRFSARKPRDVQLAAWIAEDIDTGQVNVSEVIKDLLYAWYARRHEIGILPLPGVVGYLPANGGDGAGVMGDVEGREDPDDDLVRRMVGIDFSELGG
jgi:hypothetical protein